jgi:hypothetical protein
VRGSNRNESLDDRPLATHLSIFLSLIPLSTVGGSLALVKGMANELARSLLKKRPPLLKKRQKKELFSKSSEELLNGEERFSI